MSKNIDLEVKEIRTKSRIYDNEDENVSDVKKLLRKVFSDNIKDKYIYR